ncbi:MAG TPA: hypothetical protein VFD90_13155 [Gaiellales bacterium]|jgi:hypothetical protein|nr:hypothetical protein [Gaiellales bacterium]
MGDELARALERRTLRARQVGIACAAALLAVLARHASRDLDVTALAAGAAVITFVVALALAHLDVRERSIDARAVAPPRRVRTVARSLERLARLAERGAAEPRQTRPPSWVLELAPEAGSIRELAMLLRARSQPPVGTLEICDRFVFNCWNAELRGLDQELLRRELGRVRFALELLAPLEASERDAAAARR